MTDAAESVVNGMSPSGRTSPFRQFGFGDRGAAGGFRTSARRVGRAGRAEIPAAVRAAGAAARRRASDRSGPACRRFRGGTCERFACPDLVYSGDRAFPAGSVDARISSRTSLRQGIATFGGRMRGFLTNEACGRGRGVAHLDARAHSARSADADAPRSSRAFPCGRRRRVCRRNHFCGARRRADCRSGEELHRLSISKTT